MKKVNIFGFVLFIIIGLSGFSFADQGTLGGYVKTIYQGTTNIGFALVDANGTPIYPSGSTSNYYFYTDANLIKSVLAILLSSQNNHSKINFRVLYSSSTPSDLADWGLSGGKVIGSVSIEAP